MGFVFLPYWSRGHVAPMLSVAAELRARGQEIQFVVGRRYGAAVEAAGVTAVLPPSDHDVRVRAGWGMAGSAEQARLWWDRRKAWRRVAQALRPRLRAENSDVWIVDPHVSGLIRSLGLPDDRVIPFWTTYARSVCSGVPMLINTIRQLQPGYARFGPEHSFIGPLIGAIDTPDPGLPWGRLGGRVLVVAMGTVFERREGFYRRVVREFAGSEWTVVLATGRSPVSMLGDLPANVHAYQWVPQAELLRHATVFITHAGMNSVQESIAAGTPMLFAPRTREQRCTARTACSLGLGSQVQGTRSLRGAVERIDEDPRYRVRVAELRSELVLDGAARAADVVQRLAG